MQSLHSSQKARMSRGIHWYPRNSESKDSLSRRHDQPGGSFTHLFTKRWAKASLRSQIVGCQAGLPEKQAAGATQGARRQCSQPEAPEVVWMTFHRTKFVPNLGLCVFFKHADDPGRATAVRHSLLLGGNARRASVFLSCNRDWL